MEEISISIEETNKLRAQVGLAPIPMPDSKLNDKMILKDELSIEETNRVRVSLGLKPIEVIETRRESKPIHEQDRILKEKLHRTREKLHTNKKLKKGTTLLDNYEDQSTDDWLSNIGKPKIIKHQISTTSNKAKDPKHSDIQISHSIGELQEIGDNEVFTLNDKDILNESEDELSNFGLSNKAKVAKDLEEKQKATEIKNGIGYKPLDDGNNDIKENVIIRDGSVEIGNHPEIEDAPVSSLKRKVELALFDEDDDLVLNLKPKEKTTMKKIKKKKGKSSKSRIKVDDDDLNTVIQTVKLTAIENDIEDDLESTLSLQRKLRQLKRHNLKPEDIAKEIRSYAVNNEENEMEKDIMKGTGAGSEFVFDPTSDFLTSLDAKSIEPEVIPVEEPVLEKTMAADSKEQAQVITEPEISVKEVKEEQQQEIVPQDLNKLRLGGIGKTLKYLRAKNLVSSPADHKDEQREKSKQLELTKIKISIEERKLKAKLEADTSYKKLNAEEQETMFQTTLDEILLQKNIIRPNADVTAKEYTPKIDIRYKNDSGQELNTKQAYKYLSGKFHGTSKEDKGKTNKRKPAKKPLPLSK